MARESGGPGPARAAPYCYLHGLEVAGAAIFLLSALQQGMFALIRSGGGLALPAPPQPEGGT
eukprot:10079481-Lingulodinium_polyedra.AAC.1